MGANICNGRRPQFDPAYADGLFRALSCPMGLRRIDLPVSALDERDDRLGEPLRALDALRDGLAPAIEDQLMRAARCKASNVAGDVFRRAGEGPAGPIRDAMPAS